MLIRTAQKFGTFTMAKTGQKAHNLSLSHTKRFTREETVKCQSNTEKPHTEQEISFQTRKGSNVLGRRF